MDLVEQRHLLRLVPPLLQSAAIPVTDDDQRRSRSVTVSGVVVSRANTVTVTVTYTWNTGLFGTIPVSSSSTMPMSY